MVRRSPPTNDDKILREKVIGLGPHSHKKSYYSELQKKLAELERFRALLDRSNDAVFMLLLPSGRLFDVNETACRILQQPRENILACPFSDLAPGLDKDYLSLPGNVESGKDAGGRILRTYLQPAKGAAVPVEIGISRVDRDNESYVVVTARDISETLKAEADLLRLNEELELRVKERTLELTRANERLRIDELRLEALLILNQMTGAPIEDLAGYCLEKALVLTRSHSAYLAFLGEEEELLNFFTVPPSALPGDAFPSGFMEEWRTAANQRAPFVIREGELPGDKGRPPPRPGCGFPFRLHLPVLDGGRIVMVAGAANPKAPYTPIDIRQLTLLLQGMWATILRNRDHEEKIRINRELALSLENLQSTQAQLVESEKMASLGNLVAGVAHEINTPLGVGITEASFLEEKIAGLQELFASGRLKRSELNRSLATGMAAAENLMENLKRAAGLVESFKQVAVDSISEERRRFNLEKYIGDVLSNLGAQYREIPHTVTVHTGKEIIMDSYPGAFSRIITHLVVNSMIHGLKGIIAPLIEFNLDVGEGELVLKYRDNGKGMGRHAVRRIFDPFFTTNRTDGGTGLGMHIVYNLVTRTLGGRISCRSAPGEGVLFTLNIPLKAPPEPAPRQPSGRCPG